jgi:hypothetical protein
MKVGLAMRPPISPGLSPATGQRETRAMRVADQRWGAAES